MPNRRQFLGFGLAASVWPGLTMATEHSSTSAPAHNLTRFPLYKAIYDTSYAPAVAFAVQMREHGVAVHAIDGDITYLWFNDLALRWRKSPVAIAGLTAPQALFCLEQLAWDHRMRVVFRATHAHRHDIAVEQVRARGWGAAMANLAIYGPQTYAGSEDFAVDTHARAGDAEALPLVSWVIAPVIRT